MSMPEQDDDALLAGLADAARARQAAEEAEPDAELAALLEPPRPGLRDVVIERIQAAQAAQAAEVAANPTPPPRHAAPVISLAAARRRRRRMVSGALGVVAAAAAAVLLLIPRVEPLPGYALLHSGGDAQVRADPAATAVAEQRLRVGSRLRLVLRPSSKVEGPVAVRAFARAVGAAAATELALPAEISPDGGVKIDVEVGGDVALAPGDWDLFLAVGRPDVLPVAADAPAAGPDPRTDGWQLVHLRLVVEPR